VPAREPLRTFLACAVDAKAAAAIYDALAPLRDALREPAFRWIDPRNYHVTLRFFGDLTRGQIDSAVRSVEPIAATIAPVDCRVGALLALPNARRPNVLAFGLDSDGSLERIAARANAAFERDFGAPDKPFKAHLTVARCRRGARFTTAATLDFALRFDRIALFESSQAPTGVRYAPLEAFALQGP
jgi:RNA 2',3'-cyclic 3'-phosphodiesterase